MELYGAGMTDRKTGSKKNVYVEVVRIFLTLAICMHHFRMFSQELPYGGGYLATDCFFMIGGFYIVRWINRHYSEERILIGQYLKLRIKRLYPQYLFALSLSLMMYIFVIRRTFEGEILRYISEALMLPVYYNDAGKRIIPPDWYVGYLLLGSIIVFLLIWGFKKNRIVSSVAFLLIAVSSACMLVGNYISLCAYPSDQGIFSIYGLCRTLLGMSIGVLIAKLSEFKGINKIMRAVDRSIAEKALLILLSFTMLYFLFWYPGWSYRDYIPVAVFAVLFFMISDKEGKLIGDRFDGIICGLSSKCYIVFLNHFIVVYTFRQYLRGLALDWKAISVLYFLVVIIYVSLICLIQHLFGSIFKQVRNHVI